MFGDGFVGVRRHVVRGFSQREQAHLLCGVINQLDDVLCTDTAMHDLEYFLIANHCFEVVVVPAREKNADGVGRTFFGFSQRLYAAHAGQLQRRNNDVNRSLCQRVQSFGAARCTMHRIAIIKTGTQVIQRPLLAVQYKHLRSDLFRRQNRFSGSYV